MVMTNPCIASQTYKMWVLPTALMRRCRKKQHSLTAFLTRENGRTVLTQPVFYIKNWRSTTYINPQNSCYSLNFWFRKALHIGALNRYHEPQKLINDLFLLCKDGGTVTCKLKESETLSSLLEPQLSGSMSAQVRGPSVHVHSFQVLQRRNRFHPLDALQ